MYCHDPNTHILILCSKLVLVARHYNIGAYQMQSSSLLCLASGIYCDTAIPNNAMLISPPGPLLSKYEYDTEIEFACLVGFEKIAGDSMMTCMGDQTWSGELLLCESKDLISP